MSNHNPAPLTEEQVNAMVDAALLAAVQNLGVPARAHDGCQSSCIDTGFNHFHLHPVQTQIAGQEGGKIFAILNVQAVVKDPLGYGGAIQHLAMGSGPTVGDAIQGAANLVTLDLIPPICRLFGAHHGPEIPPFKVSSYTEGDAQATEWEGFMGPMHVFGDDNLYSLGTPIGLVVDTISNYLAQKRLHWIKIFGIRHETGQTEFTVAIDNEVDPRANAEALRKFDWSPYPNTCSFRQFFVIRPKGLKPLEEEAALLQRIQEQNFDTTPRAPRKWFPLGRKH